MSVNNRAKHDKAYLYFLPTGLLGLALGMSSAMPMGTGTAGGIGLLVLVPLALYALISVPKGIYLAIKLRTDTALLTLAALTALWVLQLFVEAGPPSSRNFVSFVYGLVIVILVASWFLHRRRQTYSV